MKKHVTELRSRLTANVKLQQQKIDKKTGYLVLSALLFVLFADTILPFIGHLLHAIFEFTELLLEHFLESAFHVKPKHAEIIVFYTFLVLAFGLLRYLSRKCYCWCEKKCANAKDNWCAKARSEKYATVFRTALMITVVGKILFFMFA